MSNIMRTRELPEANPVKEEPPEAAVIAIGWFKARKCGMFVPQNGLLSSEEHKNRRDKQKMDRWQRNQQVIENEVKK